VREVCAAITRSSGRPYLGHKTPQIILECRRRRGRNGDIVTFDLSLMRIINLAFIVSVPNAVGATAPVYVRAAVNAAEGDAPGSLLADE